MFDPIIKLENVSKCYGTVAKTLALRDVNLRVSQGEFAAILGPSGSGKSTLLNLLGALDRPTEGTVWIADKSLSELDSDGLARLRQVHLGFVFQFHHLLPNFTALENVLMPTLAARGKSSREERDRALDVLAKVGLEGFEDRRPGQLSGGQQQRVAIARALAGSPSVVLADEPTGNLDTANGRQVFDLMRRFNKTERLTFLIITHDIHLARYADRIIEIVDGAIRFDGRSEDYAAPAESQ